MQTNEYIIELCSMILIKDFVFISFIGLQKNDLYHIIALFCKRKKKSSLCNLFFLLFSKTQNQKERKSENRKIDEIQEKNCIKGILI